MKKRSLTQLGSLLALIGLSFFVAPSAHALDWAVEIAQFLGNGVAAIVWILGKVLVIIIYLVVWVAQYNDFIKSTAVSEGWIIVRDVCNMFFIVILLVIAFGTVLNIEKYSWKHLLPKVLLMAVLINFSKLICGVFIDFSQVIMLSFVNGFRDIAGGNFANMAGITDILGITSDSKDVTLLSLAGTYVLALLYVIISLVVMVVILFILVIRIVMLWILVVLSPLAYFLQAVPGNGEKYAGQWWSQFTNNLVSGPLLAFFIWLAFVTVTPQATSETIFGPKPGTNEQGIMDEIKNSSGAPGGPTAGLSQAGTPEGMLKFVISIGLLVGGLMVTKQLSGAVGSIAGAGMGKIQGGMKGLQKFGAKKAVNTGKFAGQTALRAAGKSGAGIGNYVSKVTGGKYGESLQKGGAFLNAWGSDIRSTRQDEKKKKRKETLEKLGMKETAEQAFTEFNKTQLAKGFKGAAVTAGAAGMAVLSGGIGLPAIVSMLAGAGWAGMSMKGSKKGGEAMQANAKEREMDTNIKETAKVANETRANVAGLAPGTTVEAHVATALAAAEATNPEWINHKNTRDAEHVSHNNTQAAEEQALEHQFLVDTNNMPVTSDAYKNRKQVYDDDLKNIKSTFAERHEKTNEKYEQNIMPIITATIGPEAAAALAAEKAAKDAVNIKQRHEEIEVVHHEEKADLKKSTDDRRAELASARKKLKDSPMAQQQELARINTKYDQADERIRQMAKDKEKKVKDNFTGTPDFRYHGKLNQFQDYTGGNLKGHTANRLTGEAAALGAKEFKAAMESINALADEHIRNFAAKDFSTPTGPNTQQEKLLRQLVANTADSKRAMLNMTKGLKEIKDTGQFSKNKDMIEGMMRGIAHMKSKDPSLAHSFDDLVAALNSVHPEKNVDSFAPKTK